MNKFFEMLKDCFPNGITQEEWEQALIDEEYLDDNILTSCFHCQETNNSAIISGHINVFKYIEEQMNKSDLLHRYYLEYAKDWLYSAGIYEDTFSNEALGMQAIICQNCGAVLGFSIAGELYYPYMGYLTGEEELVGNRLYPIKRQQNDNLCYRNIIKNELNINNIKENITTDYYKENLILKEKIDLLNKLDNNKKKLSDMMDLDPYAKDINKFLPILQDTLRALEKLNDIVEQEDR